MKITAVLFLLEVLPDEVMNPALQTQRGLFQEAIAVDCKLSNPKRLKRIESLSETGSMSHIILCYTGCPTEDASQQSNHRTIKSYLLNQNS